MPALVRALIRHGIDAELVTTDADPDGPLDVPVNRRVVLDGVPEIFHHAWAAAGRWGFAPAMIHTLRRTVATCDLVHIHWLFNFSCVASAAAAVVARVPFVVQPHGSLDPYIWRKRAALKRLYLATIGRPLLTRAASVVFTAEEERRRAVYPPTHDACVVPTGIDLSVYDSLPEAGRFRTAFPSLDGPFLLALGRVSPQKGLDLLIKAFALIGRERPELRLVIAGPDWEGWGATLRDLARTCDVERRVMFTGMLTDDLKLAALRDAEMFVLPSYMENFGVAIVEALACGVPVVISDRVQIHRELASAGAAAVAPCTVEGVASAVIALLANASDRRRLAAAGSRLVRARYGWDTVAPALIARYAETIRRNRARTAAAA